MKLSFFVALVFAIQAFISIEHRVDCFKWSDQAKTADSVLIIYSQCAHKYEINPIQDRALSDLRKWRRGLSEEDKLKLSGESRGRMVPAHYLAALDLCYLIITAPTRMVDRGDSLPGAGIQLDHDFAEAVLVGYLDSETGGAIDVPNTFEKFRYVLDEAISRKAHLLKFTSVFERTITTEAITSGDVASRKFHFMILVQYVSFTTAHYLQGLSPTTAPKKEKYKLSDYDFNRKVRELQKQGLSPLEMLRDPGEVLKAQSRKTTLTKAVPSKSTSGETGRRGSANTGRGRSQSGGRHVGEPKPQPGTTSGESAHIEGGTHG